MRESIRKEFEQKAIDYVNDGVLTNDNKEEWHFYLFNEDYYLIGNRRAENWLTLHDVSPFKAMGIVKDYQEDNYGETDEDFASEFTRMHNTLEQKAFGMFLKTIELDYSSPESVVNMLAYVLGEEWMQEDGEEFIQNYIN